MKESKKNLTREEAVQIISKLPFLAAACSQKLLPEMIKPGGKNRNRPPVLVMEFEVCDRMRSYVFEEQPFKVLREITFEEYQTVVPGVAKGKGTYYYEVHTD